jgi:hypothetical protein
MADIGKQLRRMYQEHGMEPNEISYNDNLGYWKVSVQVQGSNERFHDQKGEIGGSIPVDYNLDSPAVRTAVRREIDGARIPSGTVRLEKFESEYAHLTIEDDD